MAASRPRTITFAIAGAIDRDGVPALCEQLLVLLARAGADVAVCDLAGVAADAVSVDALARLQLAARRQACRIEFRHASAPLRELIAFMGLADVLALDQNVVRRGH
jgi:ABC-type transporter Mla MlaB component